MTYLPPVNGGRINATISGNTAGAGALVSSGTLTLAGGNNITLSQNGNAITISGGAGGGAAGSNTLGMSNLGNTIGTSGVVSGSALQFAFAGGNNVTLSQSLNASSGTITISAANQTVQTQNVHNVTLSGNTAGAMAHISSGTLTLAGGNNITLSQNGNAVTISGGAGGGGGIALANSQTTYTSGTANLSVAGGAMTIASTTGQSFNFSVPQTSSLSATGGISLSTNGSTISIGAPAQITYSRFDPLPEPLQVQGQIGQGSLHLQPFQAPNFQFDRAYMGFIVTNATNTTGTLTASLWLGLYTRNSSSLSLVDSASASFAVTYSGTVNNSTYAGIRNFSFGWTNTMSANDYWLGVLSRTTTAGANASISGMHHSQFASHHSGVFGAAVNATNHFKMGLGVYSSTTSAMPNSIAFNSIMGTNSQHLRIPIVRFLSQSF